MNEVYSWDCPIDADEIRLYPISVKSQSGEKLELQVTPSLQAILLQWPPLCFFLYHFA